MTDEEKQAQHMARRDAENAEWHANVDDHGSPPHDMVSCWCCCWTCDFDDVTPPPAMTINRRSTATTTQEPPE